ncbi:recombinase family protein [Myxococcota bacterium]
MQATSDSAENRKPKRAAQYVRMSTEHQQYSTENQEDVIAEYATKHELEIVRTYADEGKSGLNLAGRSALQRLLKDVQAGRADFEVILVYDVSRWGRFQDADESAYYEYVCKRAGIVVQYCAEQFENDGSTSATIIKTVKRAMAGEYSRELSRKVFQGQCRLIELGFRQGGRAGYGLRRMRINDRREHLGLLDVGERKSLQTDRVILVPGPRQEVEVVQWVYEAFVSDGQSETEIADQLNSQGIANDVGTPWTRGTVREVLTNEKYIGNNVYNRQSFKLKQVRVRNSPDMWIRAEQAFEPIVSVELFYRAQGIIQERNRRYTNDELLDRLRALCDRHGKLSGILIDEAEDLPCQHTYRARFGGLVRAYQLIGYEPERDYEYVEINRQLRERYPHIIEDTVAQLEMVGAAVLRTRSGPRELLRINELFTCKIILSRCKVLDSGRRRWRLCLDQRDKPDLYICARMGSDNQSIRDFYVLPRIDMVREKLRLAEDNGRGLDCYRFDDLSVLRELSREMVLQECA